MTAEGEKRQLMSQKVSGCVSASVAPQNALLRLGDFSKHIPAPFRLMGPSSPCDSVCLALLFDDVVHQERAWDGLNANKSYF